MSPRPSPNADFDGGTLPWTAESYLTDGGQLALGMFDCFSAMPTAACRYLFTQCVTTAGAAYAQICQLPRL